MEVDIWKGRRLIYWNTCVYSRNLRLHYEVSFKSHVKRHSAQNQMLLNTPNQDHSVPH